MPKIIVGIHGLANKPERPLLTEWWRAALVEGLEKNEGLVDPDFEFRLVYWADLLYKNPLHHDPDFDFDSLYDAQVYYEAASGALQTYREGWRDRFSAAVVDTVGSAAHLIERRTGWSALSDYLIRRLARDLSFYYDEHRLIRDRVHRRRRARAVLLDELKDALRRASHGEIMLIAHSMGSIVAYDALRDLGREDPVNVDVDHFLTIGSPLGLATVRGQITEERSPRSDWSDDPLLRTPTVVGHSWVNFADKDDPVAADTHLRDDYAANQREVRVVDDLVANDYRNPGDGGSNAHKSYGYLRTPELSRRVAEFLRP